MSGLERKSQLLTEEEADLVARIDGLRAKIAETRLGEGRSKVAEIGEHYV